MTNLAGPGEPHVKLSTGGLDVTGQYFLWVSDMGGDRADAFEAAADPLRTLFFAPDRREPFAALHALADDGF